MRCSCCNVVLTPYESTIRSESTNEFLDMCEKCLSFVANDIKTLTREDLKREAGMNFASYIAKEDSYD